MKKTNDGKYVGSRKTQERVEAELKEKEDEEWKKEKEREDRWERQSKSRGDVEEEWMGESGRLGEGEDWGMRGGVE